MGSCQFRFLKRHEMLIHSGEENERISCLRYFAVQQISGRMTTLEQFLRVCSGRRRESPAEYALSEKHNKILEVEK